jgi:hypothetical protein
MPAHYPVPIQEDIRDLLHELLGRGVAVDKVGPIELDEDEPFAIAEYLTDDDQVAALCILDGPFAVRAGAALVLVPAAVAEESLRKNEVEEQFFEYVQEVLNILSRLLNSPSTPHLRLQSVHRLPGATLPDGVTALRDGPAFRRDFAVTIEGYGDGRFSLLVN